MVGCNGIVVSRKVSIGEKYRGKGYGTMFCELRESIGRKMDYSVIMCTVVYGNEPQEKIMRKRGWFISNIFLNRKTGNRVAIYYKSL